MKNNFLKVFDYENYPNYGTSFHMLDLQDYYCTAGMVCKDKYLVQALAFVPYSLKYLTVQGDIHY